MKRVILYLSLSYLVTALSACQKEVATPSASNEIVGEWNWVSSTGGIAGATYTPASTGTNFRWVFKSDSTFQRYEIRQGTAILLESVPFSIQSARSIFTGQPGRALLINPSSKPRTYIIEKIGTQLVVDENNPDGFGHIYQRQ